MFGFDLEREFLEEFFFFFFDSLLIFCKYRNCIECIYSYAINIRIYLKLVLYLLLEGFRTVILPIKSRYIEQIVTCVP